MKKCIKCGTMLDVDDLFCHECGAKQEIGEVAVQNEETATPLEKKCIYCGETIEVDSAFCPYCGKPQIVEDTKATEPEQIKTPVVVDEPREVPSQETSDDQTNELEEEKKSKKWVWVLLLLLIVLGFGGWYYIYESDSSNTNQEYVESDSIAVNDIVKEESDEGENVEYLNAEDFLKKMYDDFYEPYNSDRFSKQSLSKYFSDGVLSKFYVEDYYSGKYFYCTDFLVNGCISGGGEPDYGDKVVKRTIENKGSGWYEVTNIWDVINTPVKVRLKVDNIGSKFFISDFVIIENEHESTKVEEEVPDEAAMMDNLAKRNIEANNLNE